jgi:hypothetical protein
MAPHPFLLRIPEGETAVSDERLEAFNEKLRQRGLFAYWMRPEQARKRPEPRINHWADIYPLLVEAGEVVRLGGDGDARRSKCCAPARRLGLTATPAPPAIRW